MKLHTNIRQSQLNLIWDFVFFHKQFSGVKQEDTQEFLGELLNSLNEELNEAPNFDAVYLQQLAKDPSLI